MNTKEPGFTFCCTHSHSGFVDVRQNTKSAKNYTIITVTVLTQENVGQTFARLIERLVKLMLNMS